MQIFFPVDALVEFSREEVHSHNGEDEPEYHDDEQYVADGRQCLNEGIDNYLLQ